jgi:acetylornithine/succinyldiaminopimelate/putrescine aminotransferase
VAAIREQAGEFAGSSNLYYSAPAMRLSERLSESSLGGRVFLCNSGAEASEGAIKLVRKRAHARGVAEPEIVTLEGAFHGRTLGALAATPKLARDDLFGPLPRGFRSVPRDDPDALHAAVGERTAAVMIEPIQGEAGIFPIADEVLVAALDVIDDQELLARVTELGDRLRGGLEAIDAVTDVRGRGLMIGLSLAEGRDAAATAAELLDAGLVLNVPGERMLRLLPPLVIEPADVDEALVMLGDALA